MYNVSLFTQFLSDKSAIIQIANDQKVFDIQEIFCDKSNLINYGTSIFHTYFLIGERKLVLSDASVYNIANIYNSNDFICVDNGDLQQQGFDNVEFIDTNSLKNNLDQKLREVLQQEKYNEYKI